MVIGSGVTFEQARATAKTDKWFNWCNDVYGRPCHGSYVRMGMTRVVHTYAIRVVHACGEGVCMQQ